MLGIVLPSELQSRPRLQVHTREKLAKQIGSLALGYSKLVLAGGLSLRQGPPALDGLHELADGKLDWALEELRSSFPPGHGLRGNPEVLGKLGLPEAEDLPGEFELWTADEFHVPGLLLQRIRGTGSSALRLSGWWPSPRRLSGRGQRRLNIEE